MSVKSGDTDNNIRCFNKLMMSFLIISLVIYVSGLGASQCSKWVHVLIQLGCLALLLSPYQHLTHTCTHTYANTFTVGLLAVTKSWNMESEISHRGSESCGWGCDQDCPSIYGCQSCGSSTHPWLWFCYIALEMVCRVLFHLLEFLWVPAELPQGLEDVLPPAFGTPHFQNFSW